MHDRRAVHEHEIHHVKPRSLPTSPPPHRITLHDALSAAWVPLYLLSLILLWPTFAGGPPHPLMWFGLVMFTMMGVTALLPES